MGCGCRQPTPSPSHADVFTLPGPSENANTHLKKLRVSQISRRECSKWVQQLPRATLCAWQEQDTNGNSQ
ncbi:Hypothetical predicted protein, partial [Marmota monax]